VNVVRLTIKLSNIKLNRKYLKMSSKSHAKLVDEIQEIVCDNYNIEWEEVAKVLRVKFSGPLADYASALGHKFWVEIQNDLMLEESYDGTY